MPRDEDTLQAWAERLGLTLLRWTWRPWGSRYLLLDDDYDEKDDMSRVRSTRNAP